MALVGRGGSDGLGTLYCFLAYSSPSQPSKWRAELAVGWSMAPHFKSSLKLLGSPGHENLLVSPSVDDLKALGLAKGRILYSLLKLKNSFLGMAGPWCYKAGSTGHWYKLHHKAMRDFASSQQSPSTWGMDLGDSQAQG